MLLDFLKHFFKKQTDIFLSTVTDIELDFWGMCPSSKNTQFQAHKKYFSPLLEKDLLLLVYNLFIILSPSLSVSKASPWLLASYIGFVWWGFGSRASTGVAAVRSWYKLPLYLVVPNEAGSRMDHCWPRPRPAVIAVAPLGESCATGRKERSENMEQQQLCRQQGQCRRRGRRSCRSRGSPAGCGEELCPCSSWRATVEQRPMCSPWRSPAGAWRRLWALGMSVQEQVCCQDLWPHGGLTLE